MIIAACAVLLLGTVSHAAVPTSITVQGKLTDAGGIPLPAGVKTFTFRIFDAASFGTQIWPTGGGSEDQSLTTDAAGLWIGLIGALSPLNDAVFTDSVRWLEVSVSSTTLPRIRLVTGPYAYRVATVDGASGGTITSKVSIGPGHVNTGINAFVAGENNSVTGNQSTVSGGRGNDASAVYSTVAGGINNVASGPSSTVGGGEGSTAQSIFSTVGGGFSNNALSTLSTVGGGGNNTALGSYTTVAGGLFDSAWGNYSTVGGGGHNTARGRSATVAGGGGSNAGDGNSASGDFSAIGGGTENISSAWSSVVAGGFVNVATDSGATVGGGVANGAAGLNSTVAGGNSGIATGDYSFIGGGFHNSANDIGAAVAGGGNNYARGLYSTVGGGGGTDASDSNSVTGWWGTIGGGRQNTVIEGYHGTIAGGVANVAGQFAAVGGGGHNTAYGGATVIGGGEFNVTSSFYATVSGGQHNDASGEYSTVPGGYYNTARGDNSLAAGFNAKANHPGSFVWSDRSTQLFDSAYSTAPNQFIIRAVGGVGIGTNSPSTATGGQVLHIDNPLGPSVMRLGDGEANGIQWEVQSTVIGGVGALNFSNITAFTNPFKFFGNGNFTATGCVVGSNIACPSDARFKRKIETLPNALGVVEKLRGVRYEWRSEEFPDRDFVKGEQIGLVAQEVREIVPQAVIEQSDGYLAVDYARLVPLLIEGMKEQQRQIDELKSRLDRQTP